MNRKGAGSRRRHRATSKRLRSRIPLDPRGPAACHYCGVPTVVVPGPPVGGVTWPPDMRTRDHVVPSGVGGLDKPWNIVIACYACNGGRAQLPPLHPACGCEFCSVAWKLHRVLGIVPVDKPATPMLTSTAKPATIGGMSETTITRQAPEQPRRRTATYRLVETLLRQKLGQPRITLEAWVIAQRKLGVAWRPMAPKLAEAAGLNEAGLAVGYEALRRWFDYLAPDESETGEDAGDAVAARVD